MYAHTHAECLGYPFDLTGIIVNCCIELKDPF